MIARPPDSAKRAPVNTPEGSSTEMLEHYRALVSRLVTTTPPLRTLGLTSCVGGEGVSTVASHLARAAASFGLGRVLLVDAHLARPSLHHLFALESWPGLAEVLLESVPVGDLVQPTGVTNLSVLTAGRVGERSARLPDALEETPLEGFQEDFDLAVFDLPATAAGPATARLAARLGGAILVIEAESTPSDSALREAELLAQAGVRLLGVAFNKRRQYVPSWLHRHL